MWWILPYWDVGYFCILINILELCCGIQLSYMEISLVSCFHSLLGRTGVVLHLRLVIPHHWGKNPMWIPLNTLCIMVFSSLVSRNRHYSMFCVVPGTVTSNPLSLASGGFHSCTHWSVLSWIYKGDPWWIPRSRWISLCAEVSLVLFPENSGCLNFPDS